MKIKLLSIFLIIILVRTYGQNTKEVIEVSGSKNTQVVFPADIKDREIGHLSFRFVDGSNRRILRLNYVGQRPDGDLLTNLQVETVDGGLYDIPVTNKNVPAKTTYIIKKEMSIVNVGDNSPSELYTLSEGGTAERPYNHYSEDVGKPNSSEYYSAEEDSLYVHNKEQHLINICEKLTPTSSQYGSKSIAENQNIELTIKGVYSNNDELYFVFNLTNKGGQPFDIKTYRFYRSASKEKEKRLEQPLDYKLAYSHNFSKRVDPNSSMDFTLVVSKFTIAKDKAVYFDLDELDGERDIYIPLYYKRINYPINYK